MAYNNKIDQSAKPIVDHTNVYMPSASSFIGGYYLSLDHLKTMTDTLIVWNLDSYERLHTGELDLWFKLLYYKLDYQATPNSSSQMSHYHQHL